MLHKQFVDSYLSYPDEGYGSFFKDVMLPVCTQLATSCQVKAKMPGKFTFPYQLFQHKT